MEIKAPRIGGCALIFAIIYACQYGLEHATYLLTDAVYAGDVFMTVPVLSAVVTTVGYITLAVEIITLAAAVALVLLSFVSGGITQALALTGTVLATKLIYVIPHYYMTVISYGYNTAESLLFALLISVGILIIMLAEISAAIALGVLPSVSEARKSESVWRDVLHDGLLSHELLDLKNRGTAALLIAAGVSAFKSFALAVVNAISLVARYGTMLTAGDIFAMMFDLIYPIALAVIAYVLMHLIKDRSLVIVTDEESAEEASEGKIVE